SGLLMPLSGSIFLSEENLSSMSEKEIAKKMGIVLTQSVSVSYMKVFDLVSFGRYPYINAGVKMSETDINIIDNAIKVVGIKELKNRFLDELSDGERQKAALARVVAQQTDLILLDEPTAFFDFPAKMEMMQRLQQWAANEQKSILISTHDVEMALSMADNLWVIDD
ncbi:MAG: ABC transporter ATP-binding protein, partial [Bacteroidales bacterium]|nr:ABC transporter ATP-binding protein [Bacteroidales bacterium]